MALHIFSLVWSGIEKPLAYFAIAFVLLTASCFAADDDVVYAYMERKPTPGEAIARIRFVLAKAAAGFFLGEVVLVVTAALFAWTVPKLAAALTMGELAILLLAYVALACYLLGFYQNLIRRLRGRPSRPAFDMAVLRRSRRRYDA